METIQNIEQHQLVVAIRTETPQQAHEVALACIDGGIRLIEITLSVPGATEVIRSISGIEGITVGAGTVLSVKEAAAARDAGAAYIVSPHLDEEIVRFTKSSGAVSIPGACTPTEIVRAHNAGADIIKLFPFAEMGGLTFLKTIRGPLPFIKYMPSGGVTLETFPAYLAAGVSGFIIGSAIIRQDLVRAADWSAIASLARQFTSLLQKS